MSSADAVDMNVVKAFAEIFWHASWHLNGDDPISLWHDEQGAKDEFKKAIGAEYEPPVKKRKGNKDVIIPGYYLRPEHHAKDVRDGLRKIAKIFPKEFEFLKAHEGPTSKYVHFENVYGTDEEDEDTDGEEEDVDEKEKDVDEKEKDEDKEEEDENEEEEYEDEEKEDEDEEEEDED